MFFQEEVHPQVRPFDELGPTAPRALLGVFDGLVVLHPGHPGFQLVVGFPDRREQFRAVTGERAANEEPLRLEAVGEVPEYGRDLVCHGASD